MKQLKQNIKWWAKDDEMLLADTRGVTGPDCPFKQNRILSFNGVNVAEKVNHVEQGDRNALCWPADPKMGYKNSIKWSA